MNPTTDQILSANAAITFLSIVVRDVETLHPDTLDRLILDTSDRAWLATRLRDIANTLDPTCVACNHPHTTHTNGTAGWYCRHLDNDGINTYQCTCDGYQAGTR